MTQGLVKKSILQSIRTRRRIAYGLLFIVLGLSIALLLLGNTIYHPKEVMRTLLGEDIKGVTFAIWKVRLPRLLAGIWVGCLFGMSGIVFQSILKNPLASPDIIGISSSASLAASICILIFSAPWLVTSLFSVLTALGIAGLMYILSGVKGFSLSKLILIGIGIQALMRALIAYLLMKAVTHDLGAVLRWMSGSLNGVQLHQVKLLFYFTLPIFGLFLFFVKDLSILELGDELATSLGLKVNQRRMILIFCSVILVSFGTAVTGPIACVTFLAGPIASRLVGERSKAVFHAGLVGIILVLGADIVGQFLLETRFPVGIMTGILGAPYLIYLLLKLNQKGGI